jgi:hypothetical protein
VVGFIEQNIKGNIILATQPIEWQPPSGARRYKLLPLRLEEMQAFLVSRGPELPREAPLREEAFEFPARTFLASIFEGFASTPERTALQTVLSNPMDLVTAAGILSRGQTPT